MFDSRLKDMLTKRRGHSPVEHLSSRSGAPTRVVVHGRVHVIDSAEKARQMVSEIGDMGASFVGLHVEFTEPFSEDQEEVLEDFTQLAPLAVGLVPMTLDGGKLVAVRYAVDVRQPGVLDGLERVLQMPLMFVTHFFRVGYQGFHGMGLPWPGSWFCTGLGARLLYLGRYHARYEAWYGADDMAEMNADRLAKARRKEASTLAHLLNHSGAVSPPLLHRKTRLHRVLIGRKTFTAQDAAYIVAPAHAAAALYLPLRHDLKRNQLDHHHDHVELPAALEFVKIEHRGVKIDRGKLDLACQAAESAVKEYEHRLAGFGFHWKTTGSGRELVLGHTGIRRVLGRRGHLHLFKDSRTRGGFSFSEAKLEQYRHVDEAVDLLYRHSKYSTIAQDRFFHGDHIGLDGRVRPWIDPLGAASGRPSFSKPNLVGIGRIMRPVVVPDGPEYGLAELDYDAQELFIAAAHYGATQLLEDCNAGDLYCRMMRWLCRSEINAGYRDLSDGELKQKYPELRDRMKLLTLAMLYGMTLSTIAALLKVTERRARSIREEFFSRYWRLRDGMEQAERQLRDRGYIETVTGMKRFRGRKGPLSAWEKRWAFNTPIQGGGACILKLLLPRLAAFLEPRGGRVMLPIFDAALIQFPLDRQEELVNGAMKIMIATMRSLYPHSKPRVSVNVKAPWCWNKNGCHDSVERFLEDPDFRL